MAPTPEDGGTTPAHETPKQRRDRELMELLNELRLASPGVQLVFGFLLIVPFNRRFADTDGVERALYATSLGLIAAATVLLIGASVQHRLLFRRHFERRMLRVVNGVALAGLTCMGLGLVSALMFVTKFVFGGPAAVGFGAAAAALMAVVWYGLPLVRAARDSAHDDE